MAFTTHGHVADGMKLFCLEFVQMRETMNLSNSHKYQKEYDLAHKNIEAIVRNIKTKVV